MTEKRFDIMNGIELGTHSGIWDNQKQHNRGIGDELWVGEIVGLLNALNNENQALKERRHEDINDLSVIAMKYKALEKENKELKNKINTYKTTNSLLKATMDRHRTENQQIRDTINEMYETERTDLGRSVLKQLIENIGE